MAEFLGGNKFNEDPYYYLLHAGDDVGSGNCSCCPGKGCLFIIILLLIGFLLGL
jgi:hypothetical protein